MDLPKLPEDENESTERTPMSRGAKWMIAAVVLLVALMIVLHLSGVLGRSQLHG
jgi:hypothetical protein